MSTVFATIFKRFLKIQIYTEMFNKIIIIAWSEWWCEVFIALFFWVCRNFPIKVRNFFFNECIYFWLGWVFIAAHRLSLAAGSGGYSLIVAVHGLLVEASPVAEHRLWACELSNCNPQAQLHLSMWHLPRPGIKAMSPALAGRFLTTGSPGKPNNLFF